MKKLYKVCQLQKFDYKYNKKKTTQEYIYRKAKYIYTDSSENAIKLYKERYRCIKTIFNWDNWWKLSEGVNLDMEEWNVLNLTSEIICIDINGTETINEIKSNMFALEFKEWWYNNEKVD